MSMFQKVCSLSRIFAAMLALGSLSVPGLAQPVVGASEAPGEVVAVVKTRQGMLRGKVDEGLRVFKGIPYAAPPVGAQRWQPPRKPPAWKGVLDATQFRAPCATVDGAKMADGRWIKRAGADFFIGVPVAPGASEDCLHLNIWAPARATGAAVMVWLQANGPSSNPVFDGAAFARDGIVFVSLDYRQLSLGGFAHPALTAEAGRKQPLARFQTMDQMAALRWVKQNIAAFGGDAGNVTVFGQSASAASVLQLLTLPAAKGLIDKAIVQSGVGWWTPFSLNQMERIGSVIATQAGLPGKDATAAQLRALPFERLMQFSAYNIDGRLQPENATVSIDAGRMTDVPLMIGWTDHDGSSLREMSADDVVRTSSAELLAAYADDKLSGADLGYQLYTDGHVAAPARWIARKTAQGAPTFLYQYSYVLSLQRGKVRGATHGSELPFVFDSWKKFVPQLKLNDEDLANARLMHSCWISFAKTGTPRCEGAPEWPAYTAEGDQLMDLAIRPSVRQKFRKSQLDAQEREWRSSADDAAREVENAVRGLEENLLQTAPAAGR